MENPEVEMPSDWNDHAGWERHYQSLAARPLDEWTLRTGSIPIEQLPAIAEGMSTQGWRSVWIPGCGLSPLPHLLAHLGLVVTATDISPTAVNFQQGCTACFDSLKSRVGPAASNGSLAVEIHDFRRQYRSEAFDLIINVKAFQGFPPSDMKQIAAVHADSLRKGRHAYFDTMNVQGERRDELEEALEHGGFAVPLAALNRWYRCALRDTGIPHLFILGQPMIPRTGEYEDGGPNWERDMARLREITAEYQSRLQVEQEAEQKRIAPDAKIAQVIYSTG